MVVEFDLVPLTETVSQSFLVQRRSVITALLDPVHLHPCSSPSRFIDYGRACFTASVACSGVHRIRTRQVRLDLVIYRLSTAQMSIL